MLDWSLIKPLPLVLLLGSFTITWIGLARVQKKSGAVSHGGWFLIIVTLVASLFVVPQWRLLIGLLGSGLLIGIIGWWDEVHRLAASKQLLGQLLIALIAVSGGWMIPHITSPFGYGLLVLGPWLGSLIGIMWILLVMNAINWLDGVDGLAGSVSLVVFGTLAGISLLPATRDSLTFALALIGLGMTAGFLLWNWYPARVYLGTVGSWWMGFYISLVAMVGGGKIATTILVLAWPVIDLLLVIAQRLISGRRPWQGDHERHLHYRLQAWGLTPPQICGVAASISVLLGIAAVRLQTYQKIWAFSAAGAVLIGLLGLLLISRLTATIKRPLAMSKTTIIISSVIVVLIAGGTISFFLASKPADCRNFSEAALRVNNKTMKVALADTEDEYVHGFSGCAAVPVDSGMYFAYAKPAVNAFWMKDMLVPLDIIWIANGKVTGVVINAPIPAPHTSDRQLAQYQSPGPVDAVLELPAGQAKARGITVGSTISKQSK